MTFFPNIPQRNDIPANNQPDFLMNYQSLSSLFGVDHIPFGNSIEAATSTNPCVITSTNHRLSTGNTVVISNMVGVLNGVFIPWTVNGASSTVTVVDANTFSLDIVDASLENAYIPNTGSFNCTDASYHYGYHKRVTFANPLGLFPAGSPNLANPIASLFTLLFERIKNDETITSTELYYQNQSASTPLQQLTNLNINYTFFSIPNDSSYVMYSFNTPWGINFNVGTVNNLKDTPFTVTFPVGYRYSTVYTNIATLGVPVDSAASNVIITNPTLSSFDIQTVTNTYTMVYFFSVGKAE